MQNAGNAKIAKKLYEAWNRRDWSAFEALLAPDVEWRSPRAGGRARGKAAVLAMVRAAAEAVPGARIEIRSLFEAGDVVVAECAFRGRRAAAVRTATFSDLARFASGLCVLGSVFGDALEGAFTPAA